MRCLKGDANDVQEMGSFGIRDTTSNFVERLFSLSKRIFSDRRRRLQPRTLKSLIFLKENRKLWDLELVASVVNSERLGEEDSGDDNSDEEDLSSESEIE